MRPHAQRLLLTSLIATAWSVPASASTDGPRGPSEDVPLEAAAAPELAAPQAGADGTNAADGTSAPDKTRPPVPENAPTGTARLPQSPPSERALELVPRQFGIELGWSNLAIDNLPDALIPDPRPHPHGVSASSHVLWQIAGLSRRWPTWIGPLLGLDVFPATAVSRRVIAVGYGFQLKHQFGRLPHVRPFLSYGVGAVQSWVKTIPGREIGHQLRGSFGAAFPVADRTSLTFAFVYKYQGLATFRWDDAGTLAYNFHTVGLLAGITFDVPARRVRTRNKTRNKTRSKTNGNTKGNTRPRPHTSGRRGV